MVYCFSINGILKNQFERIAKFLEFKNIVVKLHDNQ